MKMSGAVKFSLPVTLALTVAFLAGCAAPPPINWDSRIGHYTFEQAMAELGAPDRQSRLGDGKTVFKWYIRPPVVSHFNSGMSYYGNNDFGASQTVGSSYNNEMLQLTFDTNGELTAWSKSY